MERIHSPVKNCSSLQSCLTDLSHGFVSSSFFREGKFWWKRGSFLGFDSVNLYKNRQKNLSHQQNSRKKTPIHFICINTYNWFRFWLPNFTVWDFPHSKQYLKTNNILSKYHWFLKTGKKKANLASIVVLKWHNWAHKSQCIQILKENSTFYNLFLERADI